MVTCALLKDYFMWGKYAHVCRGSARYSKCAYFSTWTNLPSFHMLCVDLHLSIFNSTSHTLLCPTVVWWSTLKWRLLKMKDFVSSTLAPSRHSKLVLSLTRSLSYSLIHLKNGTKKKKKEKKNLKKSFHPPHFLCLFLFFFYFIK